MKLCFKNYIYIGKRQEHSPDSNIYGESYYQFDISDEHSIFADYQ
jgi:hypothetical protein